MRWLYVFLVLLMPLAGCATTPRSYEADLAGPYLLGTGDVLRVTVYGDTSLSTTYKVDDSGNISLPLVGPLAVGGTTTAEATHRVSAALARGYMRNPNVAIEVAEYRPFFIQGQVANGGQFAYVYGMTVRAAISTAGGFKDTADQSGVTIYRRQNGQMMKTSVGLDFPIEPGDTIVVGERWL